jgi:hypothetical protein
MLLSICYFSSVFLIKRIHLVTLWIRECFVGKVVWHSRVYTKQHVELGHHYLQVLLHQCSYSLRSLRYASRHVITAFQRWALLPIPHLVGLRENKLTSPIRTVQHVWFFWGLQVQSPLNSRWTVQPLPRYCRKRTKRPFDIIYSPSLHLSPKVHRR